MLCGLCFLQRRLLQRTLPQTTHTMAESLEFPQVYASPTEWNERLISLLSSIAFNRVYRPAFEDAAAQRLPASLEVQDPLLLLNNGTTTTTTTRGDTATTTTTTTPILLIVISSSSNNSLLDLFLETAQQSAAFLVHHHHDPYRHHQGRETNQHLANLAEFCAHVSTTLFTFVIVLEEDNDNTLTEMFCQSLLQTTTNVSQKRSSLLLGMVTISVHDPESASEVPSKTSIHRTFLPSASHLHIESGQLMARHLWVRNHPNTIVLTVPPPSGPSSLSLWISLVLFKFVFATLQLTKDRLRQEQVDDKKDNTEFNSMRRARL